MRQVQAIRQSLAYVSLHGMDVCTVDSFQVWDRDKISSSLDGDLYLKFLVRDVGNGEGLRGWNTWQGRHDLQCRLSLIFMFPTLFDFPSTSIDLLLNAVPSCIEEQSVLHFAFLIHCCHSSRNHTHLVIAGPRGGHGCAELCPRWKVGSVRK